MPIERPQPADIAEIAHALGFPSSAAHATELSALLGGMLAAFEALDGPAFDGAADTATRAPVPHTVPGPDDDPHGAWCVRTELRERDTGPLAGYRLAVKDNVMVAGLPMTAGARLLEGYLPPFDATVVERALAAGATVVGKTNCTYLCLDGGSYSSDFGVVHNPHRRGFSAGGSSSGNAAALAAGQADLAIGTDQAGSIRVPSSYCGVVGLKPTHGLVPYTGALGLDAVIDHAGPMATTVADAAALLRVIAGYDEYDPRQRALPDGDRLADLGADLRGVRVGVLTDGFGQPGAESAVDDAVRAAAEALGGLGAQVRTVSVPGHALGQAYWTPLVMHGMADTVGTGQGFGVGRRERYPVGLMEHLLERRDRVDEMPPTVTLCAIAAAYVRRNHGVTYYARAVNAVRALAASYDAVLREVDVLVMPTTPHRATPLPGPDVSIGGYIAGANDMFANTAVFNGTGHPALSVPCGTVDGLPVGMMLVGRRFDEATVLRVGHAHEQD